MRSCGHGGAFVVAQPEGIDHVVAAALGGGALIVFPEAWDVDHTKRLPVRGFCERFGRVFGVPIGNGA